LCIWVPATGDILSCLLALLGQSLRVLDQRPGSDSEGLMSSAKDYGRTVRLLLKQRSKWWASGIWPMGNMVGIMSCLEA
jgi:hypothetical protein